MCDRGTTDARLLAAVGAANAQGTAQLPVAFANIEKRLSAISVRLAQAYPEYAELANPQPLTIAATQALLKSDEVLIQFLAVPAIGKIPETTFAWAVSKTEVLWYRLAATPDMISQAVRALRCGLDQDGDWRWDEERGRWVAKREPCQTLFPSGRSQHEPLPFHLGLAHQIYKALFGYFTDIIKDKQLLIVPSGGLTSLPLGVLVATEPGGEVPTTIDGYHGVHWLAREHAMTVLPSVGSLAALRTYAKASRADRPFAGFGNPLLTGNDGADRRAWDKQKCRTNPPPAAPRIASARLSGHFRRGVTDVEFLRQQAPLPETTDELCAVGRSLSASDEDIFLGARATESTIKMLSEAGRLKRYRVVHFATHGLLASETEQVAEGLLEPALLLTPPDKPSDNDDGLLTASEVAQLKLDADCVIMSACNTASGDKPEAEALSGFARAFFYAGARSMLVSHWYVNSDAAVALTTGAFKSLEVAPRAASRSVEPKRFAGRSSPPWKTRRFHSPRIHRPGRRSSSSARARGRETFSANGEQEADLCTRALLHPLTSASGTLLTSAMRRLSGHSCRRASAHRLARRRKTA